ncbi:MAG: aldehyde dehydrogenase EutE [Peptostreptococcaceae bacterium]|nr:aldehyde dehydrogenase EutE [Peptostreptococcaceae bacterium]
MDIDVSMVEKIVKDVMAVMNANGSTSNSEEYNYGIFSNMNDAIEAADKAEKEYLKRPLSDRKKYIQVIRNIASSKDNLELMSRRTVEETGMGNYEDKLIKNEVAALNSPGIEDLETKAISGDDGLTTVDFSPFGVIGAITPTTNPTETIICNSIGMIAAGDTVVFSPHPRAAKISADLIRMLNKGLEDAGAPRNLIVTVEKPSLESTNTMMEHPAIRMLVATGGPGIVKAVLSSGKKAIGAGAGNPPVVVDETANIEKAARDIVNGASFDNNLPCTSEKEIIAVDSIADYLMFNMKKNGAYEIKDQDKLKQLTELVTKNNDPNKDFVGKSAQYILDKIGIKVDSDIRLIICEADKQHPFVQIELMMPILALVRVKDVDEAIDFAVEVEHGNRHTALIHSTNIDALTKMAKLIQTTIFVKNGPSYAGIGVGGEGYSTFTIAGPTGEGLTSAKSFARRRRCVLVGGLAVK